MIYIITNRKPHTFNYLNKYVKIVTPTKNSWSKTKFNNKDTLMYYFQYEVNIKDLPPLPKHRKMIGSPNGVLACKDKKEMRKTFIKKDISTPKTWFNIEDAEVPFIARPKYHHMGKELYVARSEEEKQELIKNPKIDETWYFSELLNLKKEYRIVLFNYEVILAYKFPLYGSVEETVSKRLEYRGTEMAAKQIPTKIPKHYEELAIKAMKTIKLGFGGLDLLVDENDNIYIGEINNSPTMYPIIKDVLKEAIVKYIETEKKNEIR